MGEGNGDDQPMTLDMWVHPSNYHPLYIFFKAPLYLFICYFHLL